MVLITVLLACNEPTVVSAPLGPVCPPYTGFAGVGASWTLDGDLADDPDLVNRREEWIVEMAPDGSHVEVHGTVFESSPDRVVEAEEVNVYACTDAGVFHLASRAEGTWREEATHAFTFEQTYDPPFQLLPPDPEPGVSWTFDWAFTGTWDGKSTGAGGSSTYTIVRSAEIEVLAGTFEVLEVGRVLDDETRSVAWLSREVGPVLTETRELASFSGP